MGKTIQSVYYSVGYFELFRKTPILLNWVGLLPSFPC